MIFKKELSTADPVPPSPLCSVLPSSSNCDKVEGKTVVLLQQLSYQHQIFVLQFVLPALPAVPQISSSNYEVFRILGKVIALKWSFVSEVKLGRPS